MAMKRGTSIGLAFGLALLFAVSAVGFRRAGGQQLKIDALKSQERRLEAELSRLRREVGSFAREIAASANPESDGSSEDQKAAMEAVRLLRTIRDLKDWVVRARSTPRLPEIKYLAAKDWVTAIRALGDGRTDVDFRNAWLVVRNTALDRTAPVLQQALKDYVDDSGGTFPDRIDELAAYIPGTPDPSLLAHYRVVGDAKGKRITVNGRSLCLDDPADSTELNVRLADYFSGGTGYIANPASP